MRRLGSNLAVLGLVAVIVAVVAATRMEFGGEGASGGRVPGADALLNVTERVEVPQGASAIRIGSPSPTCGEFYGTAPRRRDDTLEELVRAFEQHGDVVVEPENLVRAVAVSCQTVDASTATDDALSRLHRTASEGSDPTVAICEAIRRDWAAVSDALGESHSLGEALDSVLTRGDPGDAYARLVEAERGASDAAGRLEGLRLETHAGRTGAELFAGLTRRIALAHARWIGGAGSGDAWLSGPAVAGVGRWVEDVEDVERFVRRRARDPDLTPLPESMDCEPDIETFLG